MTDSNFESRSPASPDVYSFGTSPIWQEDPSQPIGDSGIAFIARTQSELCEKIAGRIPLCSIYGPNLKVSLIEASSSFVVRSEHQFNKDERRRMSIRKHVFEMNSEQGPLFSFPTRSGSNEALQRDVEADIRAHLAAAAIEFGSELLPQAIDALLNLPDSGLDAFIANAQQVLKEIAPAETVEGMFHAVLWPYIEPNLRIRAHTERDRWGKYIGFVDLRLNSPRSPVAFALLVPPRLYRHDKNVHIITGEYGRIFGGPAFASCAYSMHDPDQSGAKCAQSAAIIALALLSDRGAKMMGGYTLTYLGKENILNPDSDSYRLLDDAHSECLYRTSPKSAFSVTGLRFEELESLLGVPSLCNTTADALRLPASNNQVGDDDGQLTFDSDLLARRYLEAYLTARCPVIMLVDSQSWYEQVPGVTPADDGEDAHAVVIVGYRMARGRLFPQSDPLPRAHQAHLDEKIEFFDLDGEGCGNWSEISELIVNDPGHAPFLKLGAQRCLQAAHQFGRGTRTHNGDAHLLAVTPANIRCHASDCIAALCRADHYPATVEDYQRWREYFEQRLASPATKDYRIDLVHRDDMIPQFFHTSSFPTHIGAGIDGYSAEADVWRVSLNELKQRILELPNSWYWCISGYSLQCGLQALWLFDSRSDLPEGPQWIRNSEAAGELPDGPQPWSLAAYWSELGVAILPVKPDSDATQIQVETESPPPEVIADEPEDFFALPRPLSCSVMTSCSERPLRNLAAELQQIGNVALLDLYVLREVDIDDILAQFKDSEFQLRLAQTTPVDERSSTIVMAHPDNVQVVAEWVELSVDSSKIAAMATYFPHVTSESREQFQIEWPDRAVSMTRRDLAREALVNTVCLALELQHRGLMDQAIVEIVAGTTLDMCECPDCAQRKLPTIFATYQRKKIRSLCEVLLDVACEVQRRIEDMGGKWGRSWAFGVEVEPGATYVINDGSAIAELMKVSKEFVRGDVRLSDFLGLNYDIAHAKIIQSEARRREAAGGVVAGDIFQEFDNHRDYIVHAHICDTPGMHTRDQAIGTWSAIEKRTATDYKALRTLTELASQEERPNSLPFSGAFALELEGCAKFSWVLHSVSMMKYMAELARSR